MATRSPGKTAYELCAKNSLPDTGTLSGTVTIHDSCASRFEEPVHTAIRDLVSAKGLTIEEMSHSRIKTFCCGEGGSVGFLAPELSKKWGNLRKKEANGRRMITYCAGCANLLGPLTPTSHVLDLLFEPEATMDGTLRSQSAFTLEPPETEEASSKVIKWCTDP
jgi:Fe-S oxidoreductase